MASAIRTKLNFGCNSACLDMLFLTYHQSHPLPPVCTSTGVHSHCRVSCIVASSSVHETETPTRGSGWLGEDHCLHLLHTVWVWVVPVKELHFVWQNESRMEQGVLARLTSQHMIYPVSVLSENNHTWPSDLELWAPEVHEFGLHGRIPVAIIRL